MTNRMTIAVISKTTNDKTKQKNQVHFIVAVLFFFSRVRMNCMGRMYVHEMTIVMMINYIFIALFIWQCQICRRLCRTRKSKHHVREINACSGYYVRVKFLYVLSPFLAHAISPQTEMTKNPDTPRPTIENK